MNWLSRLFSRAGTAIKAAVKDTVAFGTKIMLGGGMPGGWASDHREEVKHFTGFNYIAVHAIATQVSGSEVTAYSDGADEKTMSVMQSRRKSLRAKHGTVSRFKSNYGLDEAATTPLDHSHPLIQLLKNPNPWETGAQFRYKQAMQIRLTGSCFVWNVPGKGKVTCERYVLPTAMLNPVGPTSEMPFGGYYVSAYSSRYVPLDDNGFVEGSPSWKAAIGKTIDARQVQVIRLPHPWWFDDGQSPISAGAHWIDTEAGVNAARIGQLRNGADPSLYIELPEDYSPDQDEMDRVTHKINQKYAGPENAGKVMLGPSGSKPTMLTTSPKDMCYSEAFQDVKSSVLSLHQTPPVAVGSQEPGAYAAYYASMLAWRHSAIQPLCDMLAESDTKHVAPQFGEGLTVEIEAPMIDDKDQEIKELQVLGTLGVCTNDEMRARFGLPPLTNGKGGEMCGGKPAPQTGQQGAFGGGADKPVDDNSAKFPTTPFGKSATQLAIDAAFEEADLGVLAAKLKAITKHAPARRGLKPPLIQWNASTKSYDPDEARDDHGRWTEGGGTAVSDEHDDDFGKDSDIQGTLYSGSHMEFDDFHDNSYLTPDSDIASEYGKHVHVAKLNVHNVFRPDSIEEVAEASGIEPLEENRFVFEELDRKKVRDALRDKGYDAVQFQDIAPNSAGDRTHEAVIVFNGGDVRKVGMESDSKSMKRLESLAINRKLALRNGHATAEAVLNA